MVVGLSSLYRFQTRPIALPTSPLGVTRPRFSKPTSTSPRSSSTVVAAGFRTDNWAPFTGNLKTFGKRLHGPVLNMTVGHECPVLLQRDPAKHATRSVESSPLRSERYLPTRHHLTVLQCFKRRPRNLRHLGSLVPGHGLCKFRMVPLGRHTHRKPQHPITLFYSRRTENHTHLQDHPRQLGSRLQ